MGAHLDRERAAARHQQPHPAAVAQAEGRGLKLVADIVPIEGEAQRIGADLHPRQMQLEQPDPLMRIEGHGFEQVEPSVSQ